MLLPLRSLYESTGAVDVVVNLTGVAASPSIGTGLIDVASIVSGVAGAPAIGVGSFNSDFALSGVVAGAAVGVTRIDLTTTLGSVSASPAIGTGTVTTATAGDVLVNLVGVAATPAIGSGTVETISIAPPVTDGLVAGGGRWFWPQEEFVYLTGVAASPEVGKVTPISAGTLDDLARMYPFPRRQVAPAPLRRIAALAKSVKAEEPPPPLIVVQLTGVTASEAVGTGTVKTVFELLDDEILILLEAA